MDKLEARIPKPGDHIYLVKGRPLTAMKEALAELKKNHKAEHAGLGPQDPRYGKLPPGHLRPLGLLVCTPEPLPEEVQRRLCVHLLE